MARFTARCSCRAVRCEIDHELNTIVNCHCTDCRRMSGCAFSSMVLTPASATEITQGSSELGAYALTEAVTKRFCTRCGTPIFNENARLPGMRMFYLGVIDQHEQLAPSLNVFCRSKLAWVDGLPQLPSFAAVPDARP